MPSVVDGPDPDDDDDDDDRDGIQPAAADAGVEISAQRKTQQLHLFQTLASDVQHVPAACPSATTRDRSSVAPCCPSSRRSQLVADHPALRHWLLSWSSAGARSGGDGGSGRSYCRLTAVNQN